MNENVDPREQRQRNERMAQLIEFQIHNPSKFVERSSAIIVSTLMIGTACLVLAIIVRVILWVLGVGP